MTIGEAQRAAFQAGQVSGDTGLFDSWLHAKGLSGRGDVLQARLRREYERGVIQGETPSRKKAADLNREFIQRSEREHAAKAKTKPKDLSDVQDSPELRRHIDKGGTLAEFVRGEVRNPVTDRAHRYRANELAEGDCCLFCGSTRFLVPDHWDGHPDHTNPENLEVLCKSCNTSKGAAFKKAGRGRLTHQYNPTKGGGAATVGEWLQAVGAITPHVDRGERGLASTMSTRDAVDMIRATPQHKRREFAMKLGRKNPTRRNSVQWEDDSLISQAASSRSVEELSRLHAYAITKRDTALLSAVEKRAKDLGIKHEALTEAHPRRWNPASYELHQSAYGAGKATGSDWRGRFTKAGAQKEFKNWVAYRRQSLLSALSESDIAGLWTDFYAGAKWGFESAPVRRNPAPSAAGLYESFHGKPATEELVIEEEVHEHEHLAVLGRLVECWIETPTGLLAQIEFDQDDDSNPVMLCSSEDGKQLYIEGGDQTVDLGSLKMDTDEWKKDRMVLGQFAAPDPSSKGPKRRKHNLGYMTKKDFDKLEEILYLHDLGEDTGVRPYLEFDTRNNRLHVSGGQYFIEQPLVGTSPGIEN